MTSLRDAIGMSVVSAATAEELGALDGVVVNLETRTIGALSIRKSRQHRVVSFDDVKSFGGDAIILTEQALVREPRDDRELLLVAGTLTVLDKLLLSDRGAAIGQVDDLEFDADSGAIVSIRSGDHVVEGAALIGVGSYAVVVEHRSSPSEPEGWTHSNR